MVVNEHFYESDGDIIYKGGICYKIDGENAIIPCEYDTDDYIEKQKIRFLINEDCVGHLMTNNYETLSEQDWEIFWNDVKMAQISLKGIHWVPYRSKHINIFEKYSIDELKEIYKDKNIWAITEHFIYYLKKYDDNIITGSKKYKKEVLTDLSMTIIETNYKIKKYHFKSDKELGFIMMHHQANEYLYELLREDDDKHSDMYDFVINNLQYASIDDLEELSKLNQNHFLIKGKGRKSKNKKILKFDLEHNLLNTYINRNACIDAEQISKQALYNVLSGKRKQLKGFIYEEEQ